MRSIFAFILLYLIAGLSSPVLSQGKMFVMAGLGPSFKDSGYGFQQNNNVLKTQWVYDNGHSPNIAGRDCTIGLHYRINRVWSIESGLQLNVLELPMHDERFQRNNKLPDPSNDHTNASNGNFDLQHSYGAPYTSLYFFPGGRSFYLSAGAMLNSSVRGTNHVLTSSFDDGQTLQMNAHFAKSYYCGYIETGIFVHHNGRNTYSSGLNESAVGCTFSIRYTFSGKIMEADYQNSQYGNTLYTDHVSANGNYVTCSLRIGFPIFTKLARRAHFRATHKRPAPGNSRGY